MTKAYWARAALFAAALPACASAHGATSTDVTPSLAAGRAAQPGSWIPGGARDSENYAVGGPAGRAAQPGSWTTPAVTPAPLGPTPLADDGPSYLGGRAAQPYSWFPPSKTSASHSQVADLR